MWANLNEIATLFGRDKSVISRHIKNIFKEEELVRDSTVAFSAIVEKEGKRSVSRDIEYFNLDLIISVGYRVNSKVATQFRIWATKTLKQHITQGFTINPTRIKHNHNAFLQEDYKTVFDKFVKRRTKDISNIFLLDKVSITVLSLKTYNLIF